MKRMIAILTAIAIAIIGTTVASAQETNPAEPPPERERAREIIGNLIEVIAAETGLTVQEIRQALSDGSTLSEVVETNGGSTQTIVDELLEQAQTRLETGIENGVITEERAAEILNNLESAVNEILTRTFDLPDRTGNLRNRLDGLINRGLISQATEALAIEAVELLAQLREGNTLAEILNANGIDPEAFITEAVSEIEIRVNEAVESGRITAEQAERLLEELEDTITGRLNHEYEARRDRPGRPSTPDTAIDDN